MGGKGREGRGKKSEVGFEPRIFVSEFTFLLLYVAFLFCSKPLSLLLPFWAPRFHVSLGGICQLCWAPSVCCGSSSVLPGTTVLISFVSVIFMSPGPTWWMRFVGQRSPHILATGSASWDSCGVHGQYPLWPLFLLLLLKLVAPQRYQWGFLVQWWTKIWNPTIWIHITSLLLLGINTWDYCL